MEDPIGRILKRTEVCRGGCNDIFRLWVVSHTNSKGIDRPMILGANDTSFSHKFWAWCDSKPIGCMCNLSIQKILRRNKLDIFFRFITDKSPTIYIPKRYLDLNIDNRSVMLLMINFASSLQMDLY